MGDTLTHARGAETGLNPISGEPFGIKEILERRTAGEESPAPSPEAPAAEDDAANVAAELAHWKSTASEAKRRADEADQRRAQAERSAADARRGAEDTGFTAVATALAGAERERNSLKDEMKTAGEAGDFSRLADIASRLGELGAQIGELERGKAAYEQQRTERLAQPTDRPTEHTAPTASGPEQAILARLGAPSREAFLATRTPETAAWLRARPEFFTDEGMFSRVAGADSLAKGRNIPPDTAEYFRFVEEQAGMNQQATRRPAETRREAVPGAPPSREATAPTGQPRLRPGDVVVTEEQKRAAEWMGVDPQLYAAEEARLHARGDLPYRRR